MGDNGEPLIYIACAVHSEHLELINCVNNMQDTRRQVRQLFLMSTQCKALNNRRINAINESIVFNTVHVYARYNSNKFTQQQVHSTVNSKQGRSVPSGHSPMQHRLTNHK